MTHINLDVEFVVITCCREGCGIVWAIPAHYKAERKNDHELFYCPNGHGQHYPQQSREEKLAGELKWCRRRRDNLSDEVTTLKHSRRSYMGHVTRLKNAAREEENVTA